MEKTIEIIVKEAVQADRERLANQLSKWRGRTVQDIDGSEYQVGDLKGIAQFIRDGGWEE